MKTIYEQLEEEEAAIEAITDAPKEEVPAADVVDEPEEEAFDPEATEEEAADPVEPVKEEPKVDNEAMARMRWENSELKRQQREAQEAAQKAIQLQQQPAKVDAEPNPQEDMEAWLAWENRQIKAELQQTRTQVEQINREKETDKIIASGVQEVARYEAMIKDTVPDYEGASAFYVNTIKQQILANNPNIDPITLNKTLTMSVLKTAATFEAQGINPALAMYNMATLQGYKPKVSEQPEQKPAQRASLETIEKNKKKSASGLGGSGGKGTLTMDALDKMSTKELAELGDEEINRIMYGQG